MRCVQDRLGEPLDSRSSRASRATQSNEQLVAITWFQCQRRTGMKTRSNHNWHFHNTQLSTHALEDFNSGFASIFLHYTINTRKETHISTCQTYLCSLEQEMRLDSLACMQACKRDDAIDLNSSIHFDTLLRSPTRLHVAISARQSRLHLLTQSLTIVTL